MFFLLRTVFWLGLVLILLPSGPAQRAPSANSVGASDAISAASATMEDVRGFCTRQPDACTVGSQLATLLGYKAQAAAKMLYQALSGALAPRETGSLASGASQRTGKPAVDKSPSDKASQSTLTPADLAPPWRGPPPRRDGKRSA